MNENKVNNKLRGWGYALELSMRRIETEWGDSAATLKIPISHRLLDGGHPSAHFNFSMCKARVNKRMCKKRMNESCSWLFVRWCCWRAVGEAVELWDFSNMYVQEWNSLYFSKTLGWVVTGTRITVAVNQPNNHIERKCLLCMCASESLMRDLCWHWSWCSKIRDACKRKHEKRRSLW